MSDCLFILFLVSRIVEGKPAKSARPTDTAGCLLTLAKPGDCKEVQAWRIASSNSSNKRNVSAAKPAKHSGAGVNTGWDKWGGLLQKHEVEVTGEYGKSRRRNVYNNGSSPTCWHCTLQTVVIIPSTTLSCDTHIRNKTGKQRTRSP